MRVPYTLLPPWPVLSPYHGGPRPRTRGVVIHNTAGGQPDGIELLATINWFRNNPLEVSAHRLLGKTGVHVLCVPDDLIAHHARTYNAEWLSIELENGTLTQPYSDLQYELLPQIIAAWAKQYGFPISRETIVGHSEIPPGKEDGKQDPGPLFDWDRLMDRLLHPEKRVFEAPAIHAPLTGTYQEAYVNVLGVANFLQDVVREVKQVVSRVP